MPVRAKQVVTIAVGVLVAIGMLLLGLWQMSSYQRSMIDVAAERASQPPVGLADSVGADGTVADIYGRRVTFAGIWMPQHEVLVGMQWPMRVATVFRLDDGRHITVVRGTTNSPTPPVADGSAHVELEGIFTAGDASGDAPVPPDAPTGSLATLRLQSLVQNWPQPTISGYVTLLPEYSAAHGLGAAAVTLPEQEGSAMHQGYALQWWVFAAAAIAFSVIVARGFKQTPRRPQSFEATL